MSKEKAKQVGIFVKNMYITIGESEDPMEQITNEQAAKTLDKLTDDLSRFEAVTEKLERIKSTGISSFKTAINLLDAYRDAAELSINDSPRGEKAKVLADTLNIAIGWISRCKEMSDELNTPDSK